MIVGGYESGLDAACYQVEAGASVTIIDPDHPWEAMRGSDPSFRLAPRTRLRLAAARATGRLTQSTVTPGLFLAGAALRHGALKFCFVYKYRQRFAHVAGVIGARPGKDTSGLQAWRTAGMLTDDLSCCGVECAC